MSKNSGVVPVTFVDQLRSSATTCPVVWTRGAAKRTPPTSVRMARRSSQVSVGSDPAPALAPPDVFAPDDTISTLVPIDANACSTRARAPSPIATIAITAATPMMMPSAVSSDRSLLRSSARSATRTTSPGLMTPPPALPAPLRLTRSSWIRPSRTTITRSRVGRDVRLVGDQHDRDAVAGERGEQRHHLVAGARIEVAGRLVGQHQARLVDQRARDRDPLLLPAGQLAGMVVQAVAQADPFQRGRRALAARARVRARVDQRQLHVLERGRAREQVEALEHEAERPVARLGERVGVAAPKRPRPPGGSCRVSGDRSSRGC